MRTETEALELYLHIPFCLKKCAYCDFLSAKADEKTKERYMKRLLEDVEQFPDKEKYLVTSVFIGGGTPTIVKAEEIKKLLGFVKGSFLLAENAEITIEANPKTVQADSLRIYREAGINRISFGLQSVQDTELKVLGRIHSYADFLESFRMARDAGFTNINGDLMFALPGQSREAWQQTLRQAARLDLQHISAYSLMIEEGTPFYAVYQEDLERRTRGEQPEFLPSEETEAQMYLDTIRILGEYGYEQYEISNFAKKGFSCRHNEGYWSNVSYAGFGLGAASYIENRRFVKTRRMEAYLAGDFSEKEAETLSKTDQMEEFMILGLRRKKGVDRKEFRNRFQMELPEAYEHSIEKYKKAGLLREAEEWICFTEQGMLLSNQVLSEFIGIL